MGSRKSQSSTSKFRSRAAAVGALAVLVCLAVATSAHAAYSPSLGVTIDPPTAGAPVSVGVDVTQASGEEATQSLRVALPGFTLATGVDGWPACTSSAESAGTCPAESRMGSVGSTTGFGDYSGDAFFGGMSGASPRVLLFFKNTGVPLVLDQEVQGRLESVPGGQELVFENLPDAAATHLAIHLDVKGRSLLAAPTRCGNYDLLGRFASAAGGHEESGARVSIGGCPGVKPAISRAALTPRTLRRRTAATALSFWLSEPATVRVTMRKSRTRRVRTVRRLTGKAGLNRVTRLGRGLAPGTWLFTVRAATADGAATRTVALRVAARR
jgi:hypothetical protein